MALDLTTPIAGRGPPPHTRQNPEATDWPLNGELNRVAVSAARCVGQPSTPA